MENNAEYEWAVKFAYSGSKSREFFTIPFKVHPGENIDLIIKKYVYHQNVGEAKSDRIRYWSKQRISQLQKGKQ